MYDPIKWIMTCSHNGDKGISGSDQEYAYIFHYLLMTFCSLQSLP